MGGNPLVSFGITTTVLAGAASSEYKWSGGAMSNIAPEYRHGCEPWGAAQNPVQWPQPLDSLPHSGAVVVLLTLCGMTP